VVAYRLLGRHEEAVTVLQKALTLNPNHSVPILTWPPFIMNWAGEDEARTEAAEVLRFSAQFSLEVWRQRPPVLQLARVS